MSALVLAILVSLPAVPAQADRDLCARGAKHRGAPIDLDVKGADLHDVFRVLSEVGGVNLVVADDVAGKVSLRVKRVPWDRIACTIAAIHGLRITVRDSILMVTRASAAR